MIKRLLLLATAVLIIFTACKGKETTESTEIFIDEEQISVITEDEQQQSEIQEEQINTSGNPTTHVSHQLHRPSSSLSSITSGPTGLGVNTREIDPVNYVNPDLNILRQMGAEPYLVSFLAGEQFYREGNLDRALIEFNASISRNSEFIESYISRGNIWMRRREYSRAIDDFTRAIRLDSSRAELFNYRGFARVSLTPNNTREINSAIEDFTRAISLNRNYVDALINRSHAFYQIGNYSAVIEDCNRIIALEPSNAIIWNRRGSAWYAREDDDKAISDFSEAIRLNENYAAAWYNRANSRYNKGDFDRALADLNRCLIINPSFAAAYTSRGNIFRLQGNSESAEADFAAARRFSR